MSTDLPRRSRTFSVAKINQIMATDEGKDLLVRMSRLSTLMDRLSEAENTALIYLDSARADRMAGRFEAADREWLVAYHKVYG